MMAYTNSKKDKRVGRAATQMERDEGRWEPLGSMV
jgi:hypothetical protein